MQNQNEKTGVGESLNEFVQKYRKPIFVSLAMVVALLVISIAALSLTDMLRGRAIDAVEEFSSRYESLRSSIHEEHADDGEEEHSHDDVEELLADLKPFAEKNSGYAGARAWTLIGSIHSERKEWAEAETAWVKAAEKSEKNYLGPASWFNAAVASEEQGKAEQAIDYYTRSLSSPAGFSSAPRAQFSIGRLHEFLNQKEEAIAAYNSVISGWPYDRVWTNLAYSKIIFLEVQ